MKGVSIDSSCESLSFARHIPHVTSTTILSCSVADLTVLADALRWAASAPSLTSPSLINKLNRGILLAFKPDLSWHPL